MARPHRGFGSVCHPTRETSAVKHATFGSTYIANGQVWAPPMARELRLFLSPGTDGREPPTALPIRMLGNYNGAGNLFSLK